ncbi:MAG: PilZ domain-containing protein [Desulfobulbaceae bacterium]|nr:MAG: PilZ domain-containing protein [Desulfobulbaceae bacterium]
MSNASVIRLVKSIADSQPARVSLHTEAGEKVHIDCIYKEGVAPRFFLVFPPNKLPEKINTSQSCLVSIRSDDEVTEPLSLNASIEGIIGGRNMELFATDTIDPTTLREFFRVNISTPITIGFNPQTDNESDLHWTMTGETLDLSGSGVLGLFDEECRNRHRLTITFDLPSPPVTVTCSGHAVYARRVRKGRWHIALHFDRIEPKMRDMIISNCLAEQRRQLMESVHPSR